MRLKVQRDINRIVPQFKRFKGKNNAQNKFLFYQYVTILEESKIFFNFRITLIHIIGPLFLYRFLCYFKIF